MMDLQRNIEKKIDNLRSLQQDLRHEIERMDNAQAKAMYETAAETLGGLQEAFEDFLEKEEAAWEKS